MYISADSLDDLLTDVFTQFVGRNNSVTASKGEFVEEIGVLLVLNNPRARLSRTEAKGTIFSCLGELLWYLAGANELSFIKHYLGKYDKFSDDGVTVFGAYGPRLFRMKGYIDQVNNIIELLERKPTSRKAVIQLFDADDIVEEHKDVPCTCTLQFFRREQQLHMFTSMRSNDAFTGLPHDIFAFTMLQELVARSLGCELGVYKHAAGSLHLYECDREKATNFLKEGLSSPIEMPCMPYGDPWHAISILLDTELKIRAGQEIEIKELDLDGYWLDFVRLLKIFALRSEKTSEPFESIQSQMNSNVYNVYIKKLRDSRLSNGTPC